MKTIILAGGFGIRLSEKTASCPKPMVCIGERPILWHLMNLYSHFGYDEFVLALGYKQQVIKDYFLNFYTLNNDMSINLSTGEKKIYQKDLPDWKVHLVDTGIHTMTGGRLKRLKQWIGNETFMLTYGDGLSDVNINELVQFHKSHDRLATVTAVKPPARFGGLNIQDDQVTDFSEKPQAGEGWINGGFFVLEPEVLNFIENDDTSWERAPLNQLSKLGELKAFKHEGFWQPMDTLREHKILEQLYYSGQAPWIKSDEHLLAR